MGDLSKLRREYEDLMKQLNRGQHTLNAYLHGKLSTGNVNKESACHGIDARNQQPSNTGVQSDNLHWTSTPIQTRPDIRSPTKRLDFTSGVQSKNEALSAERAGGHPTGKTVRWNNWTPGKRKYDLDSRYAGRGPSLAHHGSESKRMRSMERRRARVSRSKTGKSPAVYLSAGKRQSPNRRGEENVSQSRISTSTRGTEHRHQRTIPYSQFDVARPVNDDTNDDDKTLGEENYIEQLLSEGNDRLTAIRAREVTPKPKSILLTPGGKARKTPSRVSFIERMNESHQTPTLQPLGRYRRGASGTPTSSLQGSLHERSFGNTTQPLLGYDWIAGLLDTDPVYGEKSAAYLDEIKQYRQLNREECVHDTVLGCPDEINLSQSFPSTEDPRIEPEEHKCIHNYVLNDRLFAVPLHGNHAGESLCAVCQMRRISESRNTSPSYIRVSIPRSTLLSPYRVHPHRRQSFDPTDSVGLSQHCLAGWQNSRPSMMPPASTVDLRASLDRTMVAASSLFDPLSSHIYDTSAGHPLGPSRRTQELLNRSHAMRVDLQRLERSGLSMAPSSGSSRSYPLL